MHSIGDYIFDSERMIVYKAGESQEFIDRINTIYNCDDKFQQTLSQLLTKNPDKMSMNKIAIDSAGICLTYNCNLRCTYCSNSSGNTDRHRLEIQDIILFLKDIIRKKIIKKLLTKSNSPLNLYFTGGGEPTYEWELLKQSIEFIKDECTRNNIPYKLGITTNGMLNIDQIDFIAENFSHIMISYDGLPDIQNSNRISPIQSSTNDIVENTIKTISKKGISMTIRTTVWKDDFCKMRRMYDHVFSLLSKNAKVKWSIYPTLYEGRALDRVNDPTEQTYKNFLYYYTALIDYIILTKGKEKISEIEAPIYNNDLCDLFCGAYRGNNPWLLPDKSIVTCIESKENKTRIGMIKEGQIEYFKIYKDDLLRIIQKKYSKCRGCIAYRFCRGGCPVWDMRKANQNIDAPECIAQKEYWNYVIEAALLGKYSFGWRLEKVSITNFEEHEVYELVN